MPPLEHDKYYHIYNRGNNGEDLFCYAEDYSKFLKLCEKYTDPIADIYSWVLMKNHFHLLVRIKSEKEIGFYIPLNSDRSDDSARFKTTGNNNLTESAGPVRVVLDNNSKSAGPVRVVLDNNSKSAGPVRVVLDNNSKSAAMSEGNNLSESGGPDRVIPEQINFSHPINSDRSEDSVRLSSYHPINSDRSDNYVRLSSYHPINSDRSGDSVRLKKAPEPSRHFSHLFNSYAKYYNPKNNRTGALFEGPFERIEVDSIDYLRKLVMYIHTNPVHHGFTDDFTNYPWSSYQSIISSEFTKLKRDEVINWFNDIENLKYMHQMKIDTQLISDILLE